MTKTSAYGAPAFDKPLEPVSYELRAVGDDDVHIEVHYCGVCHSDIHTARQEWMPTHYPCVPGHEVTGIVKSVGSKVTKFKVGDKVGVGCMVGSCATCDSCKDNQEQLCSGGQIQTYNADVPKSVDPAGYTHGGYGRDIIVPQHFVLDFARLDLAKGAPILCAGITTYGAIKFYKLDKPGTRVGVVGLGGLGHMAVLILKAMGVHPVVISRSASKKEDAMKLGAVDFIISTDKEQMHKHASSLDGIVDTAPAQKDFTPYVLLMKNGCTMATVGAPPISATCSINPFGILMGRRQLGGSIIGGIKETQECLDFCAEHNVYPWVEMITCDKVNMAYERTVSCDVKYRFVMDVKNSAPKL